MTLIRIKRRIPVHAQRHLRLGNSRLRQRVLDNRSRRLPAKAHNLYRQRKRPKPRHLLLVISNHNHPVRGSRNDLLAQQRTTPAFDQVKLAVKLIRPVYGQIQPADLVERRQIKPKPGGQSMCALGGRNARHRPAFIAHTFGQGLHKPRRRRTCPKPKPHAIFNKIDRACPGVDLELLFGVFGSGHGKIP